MQAAGEAGGFDDFGIGRGTGLSVGLGTGQGGTSLGAGVGVGLGTGPAGGQGAGLCIGSQLKPSFTMLAMEEHGLTLRQALLAGSPRALELLFLQGARPSPQKKPLCARHSTSSDGRSGRGSLPPAAYDAACAGGGAGLFRVSLASPPTSLAQAQRQHWPIFPAALFCTLGSTRSRSIYPCTTRRVSHPSATA